MDPGADNSFSQRLWRQNEFLSPRRCPDSRLILEFIWIENNACLPHAKLGFGRLASVALTGGIRLSVEYLDPPPGWGAPKGNPRMPQSSIPWHPSSPPAVVVQEFFQEREELPGPSGLWSKNAVPQFGQQLSQDYSAWIAKCLFLWQYLNRLRFRLTSFGQPSSWPSCYQPISFCSHHWVALYQADDFPWTS